MKSIICIFILVIIANISYGQSSTNLFSCANNGLQLNLTIGSVIFCSIDSNSFIRGRSYFINKFWVSFNSDSLMIVFIGTRGDVGGPIYKYEVLKTKIDNNNWFETQHFFSREFRGDGIISYKSELESLKKQLISLSHSKPNGCLKID